MLLIFIIRTLFLNIYLEILCFTEESKSQFWNDMRVSKIMTQLSFLAELSLRILVFPVVLFNKL